MKGKVIARAGFDKNVVVEKAAQLTNKMGIDQIQLRTLAESLSIRPSSLCNHVRGLDDLRRELMIYGWKQAEKHMLEAASGADGYAAWEAVCRALYQYATENPGAFSAMLWYNKYQDKEMQGTTEKLFSIYFVITLFLNTPEENCNHLIRTLRAFLEGSCLLVSNNTFGYSLSVEEGSDLSLKVMIGGTKELERK